MPILEDVKEYVQRATGLRRPGKKEAPDLARPRKPQTARFKDDGLIPNHPRWPLVIYRRAVDLGDGHDPAAVMEDLFEANGWGKPGGTASTTTSTTTLAYTRCSASRAARGGCASAATKGGSLR